MLFKPFMQLDKAIDISPKELTDMNIKGVILDVDNTLCIKKGKEILPGVTKWLRDLKDNNIKVIILSNAKPKRMEKISQRLGLDFVALGLKPLPFGYIRASKRMNVKIKNCAVIGDQIFTDILGGNLLKIKTILVSPVELETSFGFKIKRALERKILKKHHLKCDF